MAYVRKPVVAGEQYLGSEAPAAAGVSNAVGAPTGPASSGTFDNISAFLNANKQGGEAMAQGLAQSLIKEGQPTFDVATRPGTSWLTAPVDEQQVRFKAGDQQGTDTWRGWRAADVTGAEKDQAAQFKQRLDATGKNRGIDSLVDGNPLNAGLVSMWGQGNLAPVRKEWGAIADFVSGYAKPDSGYWKTETTRNYDAGKPADPRNPAYPEPPASPSLPPTVIPDASAPNGWVDAQTPAQQTSGKKREWNTWDRERRGESTWGI